MAFPLVIAGVVAGVGAQSAAGVVVPRAACVARQGHALVAVFDARVQGRRSVTVPAGRRNRVSGGRFLGVQPTSFAPGLTPAAVRVRFLRREVRWRLGRRTAVLVRTSGRCRPPAVIAAPTVTGAARVGGRLIAHRGRWRRAIGGVRYRWQRRTAGGWAVTGGFAEHVRAVSPTDVGAVLRVVVRVRGRGGWSGPAASPPVGPIVTASPPVAPIVTAPPPAAPEPSDAVPALRPIFAPSSFWNATIPPDAAFATDSLKVGTAADGTPIMAPVNPTAAHELAADAETADGAPNARIYHRSYTAPVTVVPASTPLQPIRLCRSYPSSCVPSWAKHLDQMLRGVAADGTTYLGGGVPVPDGFMLPADGDRQAVLYEPDYVAPNGRHGRLYELWGLQPNPDFDQAQPVSSANPRLMARWGGRMVGVTGEGAGYWRDCWSRSCGYQADAGDYPDDWGRPDSQAQQHEWGATATSLPLLGSEVSRAECDAGVIDHAIGLEVPIARRGLHWWPAQRDDGRSSTTTLVEGMRLTFPPGAVKPTGLTKVGSALWDAVERYGFVIDDQSGAAITMRVEPGCERTAWWAGLDDYAELARFPWGDLRVLAH